MRTLIACIFRKVISPILCLFTPYIVRVVVIRLIVRNLIRIPVDLFGFGVRILIDDLFGFGVRILIDER